MLLVLTAIKSNLSNTNSASGSFLIEYLIQSRSKRSIGWKISVLLSEHGLLEELGYALEMEGICRLLVDQFLLCQVHAE
jgi:hypothetical protein